MISLSSNLAKGNWLAGQFRVLRPGVIGQHVTTAKSSARLPWPLALVAITVGDTVMHTAESNLPISE